jgi:hypothetical protein
MVEKTEALRRAEFPERGTGLTMLAQLGKTFG